MQRHSILLLASVWNMLNNPLTPQSPFPPLDNIRVMVIVWRLRGNIIRISLCWIVWHKMFTVRSILIWAVLTGPTDWVCHIGRRGGYLELYYCNMVDCFWWDSNLISTTNWFPSVLWHCWFGHLACKDRPRNDLLCVEWDVKPYTLTHCHPARLKSQLCPPLHFP